MKEKKQTGKKDQKSSTPEQVSPEEALERMKNFTGRKEQFIAAIKKSQN